MRLFSLVAAYAVLLIATSANAQTTPHCPSPGTQLSLSTGAILTLQESASLNCAYGSNRSDKTFHFMMGMVQAGLSRDVDQEFEKMFPLEVGKSDSATFAGAGYSSGVYIYSYEILGIEDITVPAGTFHTYKIAVRQDSSGFADLKTFWYSPELGWSVKVTYQQLKGDPTKVPTWELVAIQRP